MKRKHAKRLAALGLSALMFLAGAVPAFAVWEDEAFYEAENLVENPSFEDGDYAWEVTEGVAAPDPNAAFSGEFGMRVEGAKISQQIPYTLSPGEYEFKMNFACSSDDLGLLIVSLITDQGTQEFTNLFNSETQDWQRFGQTVTLETESEVTLAIQAAGANVPVYLDDIYLVPTDTLPSSMPLDPDWNILSNPDFESGITDWEKDNANSTLALGNEAYEGDSSLNVSAPSGKTCAALTHLPAYDAGEYEVTAYVFCPGSVPDGAKMNLGFTTAPSSSVLRFVIPALSIPVTEGGQWYKLSCYVFLLPSDTMKLRVWSDQIDDFYVDSVSMIPTYYNTVPPEPPEPPVPQNLLQNPGFESGLSGWTEEGMPCAFSTNAQSYSGTSSAYFGYFENGPLQNYLSQTVTAGAGTYTFSAYIKPDENLTGVGGMLQLEALGANGAVLKAASSPAVSDPTKGWQKVSVTLAAPTGTTSLRVKIGGVYCTGALYMDDLHLTAT